jgi:hypothetical protein
MLTEMTDVELEQLWSAFKQGEPMPPYVRAHTGPEGPELVFVSGKERYFWMKRPRAGQGRDWRKVMVLG